MVEAEPPRERAEDLDHRLLAQEALEAAKDRISGVYIMPPFGRVQAAIEILEVVGFERPAAWEESWSR